MLTTMKIAAVGECMIELSRQDEKLWRMAYAGDTFNTLWTLRALLPSETVTDYVSAFGQDSFSAEQIRFMATHKIGSADSPLISGTQPGLYAITLRGHERMFSYWRKDSAASHLADAVLALESSLAGRLLIFFSGITIAILNDVGRATLLRLLSEARSMGSLIAFDPNYRPHLWPDIDAARIAIREALAVVDIALPTFSDEEELFGDQSPSNTIDRLTSIGVSEIVVKDGANPASTSYNGEITSISAVPVELPIDTTGAGDAFNGAYLASRLSGETPLVAAQKAHKVAALSIGTRGALVPMADLALTFGFDLP
jgi:2-dehydro-3-deoxygluconokinase